MVIMYDLCEQIAKHRAAAGLTQSGLAKKLGLTRSAINAWEMGLSIPQLKYVVEMSRIFNITVDSMLNSEKESVDISELGEKEKALVMTLVDCLKEKSEKQRRSGHQTEYSA
ncbi:MAG: helix-turn-helix domain-containing protein [Firmicutes bacterium]|nr:helix-turn-helix domain-containing protein [[Eubacterium] siraeum]MCM1488227.1 helix-turn-helix domain-containing protein [Bacillota bacterium]